MADPFLHGVEVIDIDGGARSITIPATSVIGIVGTAPRASMPDFPANTPVLVQNSRALAAKLAAGAPDVPLGTLPDALDSILDQAGASVVVVRVEEGADETETLANVIGGVNAQTGQYEGVHALLASESITGSKPRLLIAPGFTHVRPADPANPGQFLANPVIAELTDIADRLRATIIADGPDTTDAAAITAAQDFGSKRVFLVDPQVMKLGEDGLPAPAFASACVAGLIARVDSERGWWWSPSNQNINGIIGTHRAIDFAPGDPNSRANKLNAAKVATIVRLNGFRLWGNRTLSADQKWTFLSTVRIADIIADALQSAHLWAVDRGITKTYVEEVRESVNAFLRELKALGAILGGSCWLDPELNTPASIAAGHVYWDFDFTPPYPNERLTFRSHLVDNYITDIF